jgi:hypothetical protein
MEILRGRFESILKAADETQLQKAIERFLAAEAMLDAFLLAPTDDAAAQNFERLRKQRKLNKMPSAGPADCLYRFGSQGSVDYAKHQGFQGCSWAASGELGRLTGPSGTAFYPGTMLGENGENRSMSRSFASIDWKRRWSLGVARWRS